MHADPHILSRLTAMMQGQGACWAVPVLRDEVRNAKKAPAPKREKSPQELFDGYLSPQGVWGFWGNYIQTHLLLGHQLPIAWCNFGTSGSAKYADGARFTCRPDTIWYDPIIEDWENCPRLYDPESENLKRELGTIQTLCREHGEEAMISFPDNCGVLDALAHLRGSEELLMDLLCEPEAVEGAMRKMLDGWKDSAEKLFDALKENNAGGSCHGWMYTWYPGRHAQLQADISVMLSESLYEQFVLPELTELSEFLDASVYHLDGQEQIRHLDKILSVPKINMIQWTPVAGQPQTSAFIPQLQKIQRAGKGLVLLPDKDELPALLDALSPDGVMYIVRDAANEQEAMAISALIAEKTGQKI